MLKFAARAAPSAARASNEVQRVFPVLGASVNLVPRSPQKQWCSSGPKREAPTRRDTHLQHSLHDGTLREKLRSRQPTVGVKTGFHNDTDHVETIGLLGYDFLWADAEHSSAGPDSVASLILAAERRGMPTLVQIGQGYQNIIGHSQKYLVAGAQGIILPRCESREDVLKIVEGVKFPPMGKRGLAGERWNAWSLGEGGSLAERVETCNNNSVVGVVIESQRGVDALDEILSVEELDFVFISPMDLSSDLGLHGQIDHHDVLDKIDIAGEKAQKAGISAGTVALTPQDYKMWRNLGFNVMCTGAHSMFVDGARGMMNSIIAYEGTALFKVAHSSEGQEDIDDVSSEEVDSDQKITATETAEGAEPAPVPDLSDVKCLKTATMKLLASKMESHEVASLREIFNLIDTNGDGDLQLEELEDCIEDGGFNRTMLQKLEAIRDQMVADGQETLMWKEYLLESMQEDVVLSEDNIQRAYDHLRETCGSMRVEDLTQAFGSLELTKEVLSVIDSNDDNEISFEEFHEAVNKLVGGKKTKIRRGTGW